MIEFWRLKPVSDAFSVPMLKGAFLQTMSESKFDHLNRILCLTVGMLVYTVSRLSKCQG